MKVYAPIFKKDDKLIILPYKNFYSEDPGIANKIGYGSLAECIMLGITYTGNIDHVDTEAEYPTGSIGDYNFLIVGNTNEDDQS